MNFLLSPNYAHPTVNSLFSICSEYAAKDVLWRDLVSYLRECSTGKHAVDNYIEWLDALGPLVKENFFLGFLNTECATQAMHKCLNSDDADYILFLHANHPGRVFMQGRGMKRDIDPTKPIPNPFYETMTTMKPLFRRDLAVNKPFIL